MGHTYKNIHQKVFRSRCYPGTPFLKKPTRKRSKKWVQTHFAWLHHKYLQKLNQRKVFCLICSGCGKYKLDSTFMDPDSYYLVKYFLIFGKMTEAYIVGYTEHYHFRKGFGWAPFFNARSRLFYLTKQRNNTPVNKPTLTMHIFCACFLLIKSPHDAPGTNNMNSTMMVLVSRSIMGTGLEHL